MKEITTRVVVYIFLVAMVMLSVVTVNGLPFRILYSFAILMAVSEAISLELVRTCGGSLIHAEKVIFAFTIIGTWVLPLEVLVLALSSAVLSDTFAYIIGKLIGHKLVSSGPFPKASPKKSWEGTIGGVLVEILILSVLFSRGWFGEDLATLKMLVIGLGGVLAVFGDVLASKIKRAMGVKDSNDRLKEVPVFRQIEWILGGRNGHGGYLDRIDSSSLVIAVTSMAVLVMQIIT